MMLWFNGFQFFLLLRTQLYDSLLSVDHDPDGFALEFE